MGPLDKHMENIKKFKKVLPQIVKTIKNEIPKINILKEKQTGKISTCLRQLKNINFERVTKNAINTYITINTSFRKREDPISSINDKQKIYKIVENFLLDIQGIDAKIRQITKYFFIP